MGSLLGAQKSAAAKCGCSVEVWLANKAAGLCWCYRCEGWKERKELAADKSRSTGVQSLCKPCMSHATTASRYRMTRDELAELKARGCAICESFETIVVDHCHKTDRVRDALCQRCNSAIGLFGDDPAMMLKAIEYLEKHSGREN